MNALPLPPVLSRRLFLLGRWPSKQGCVVALAISAAMPAASAVDRTWDGGGANDNWSGTPGNWVDDIAPVAGDALLFSGSTRLTPTNNFATNTAFNGIAFAAGAGAFLLSGNNITLNGNLANYSANSQIISTRLQFNADRTIDTAGGDITLGVIGLAADATLTKEGAHTLILNAASASTYGQWKVNAGVVRSGTSGGAFGSTVINLNGGGLEFGRSTASNYGNAVIISQNASIVSDRADSGAGLTFTMGTLSIGAHTLSIAAGSNVTSGNAGVTFGAVTLNGNSIFATTGENTILTLGAVGDGGEGHGFEKTGAGTLVLSAANGYTGLTTVSGGQLQLGNTSSLNGDIENNAVVNFNRTTATAGTFMLYEGSISGVGEVSKSGSGRTIFTADHSYTGGTTINAGTLQLGNNGSTGSVSGNIVNNGTLDFQRTGVHVLDGVISGAGAVTISTGGLILNRANTNTGNYSVSNNSVLELDFSDSGAPTDNILNNASNSSSMMLNGGHLVIAGNAGASNSQRFNGVTTASGGGTLSAMAGDGGSLTVALGAFNQTGNGAIAFIKNADTTITSTTAADAATGIYSGRAVINDGTGWNFVKSTSLGGGNHQLEAFTGYAEMIASGTLSENGGNGILEGSGGLTGNTLVNTLKVNTTGAGDSLDLFSYDLELSAAAAGGSTGLPGALLFVGEHDYSITNGSLTANTGSPRALIVQQYGAGVLTISATISNVPGGASLVKAGTGDLVLAASNAYSGGTVVQEGVLSISNVENLGTIDSAISIYGGARLRATETMALQSADGTTKKNITLLGENAHIEVSTSRTLSVSGVISGSNGSLVKAGNGTLVLNGTNTYAGTTVVSAGTLLVNGSIASTSTVNVEASAVLGGSGSVGGITGAGQVGPGNSPGIFTALSVDQSGGLDYAFEFTLAGNPIWGNSTSSGNDVLRLTDLDAPLIGAADADNVFSIYFSSLNATYVGGIFTDLDSNFETLVSGATYSYYVFDEAGSFVYNGQSYSLLDASQVTRSVVQIDSANFSSGMVAEGWAQQFDVVPEPRAWTLFGLGSTFLLIVRRRLKRR